MHLQLGVPFSIQLQAGGGEPPLTWSVINENFPTGLSLSPAGLLSGTPSELGTFTFTVRAIDSQSQVAEKTFALDVLLILSPPDIRISKAGTRAIPGRTVDYVVVVENVGSVTAFNIPVSEYVEPWFDFVSASPGPTGIIQAGDSFPLDSVGVPYDAFIDWTIPWAGSEIPISFLIKLLWMQLFRLAKL